jgi:hypothetical protein
LVKKGVLTCGPQAAEIEWVRLLRGLAGPEGCTGWAGWNEKEGENNPVHRFGILKNKLRAKGSFRV